MAKSKCSTDRIPELRVSFAKHRCLRRTGLPEKLVTPTDVASWVAKHYGCEAQEVLISLNLDARSGLLSAVEVARGGLGSTQADPRIIFAAAISAGASSIILVHNHPSGDTEPSQLDVALTKQLQDGARLLLIRVLDHLIVSGTSWTSMAVRGLLRQS